MTVQAPSFGRLSLLATSLLLLAACETQDAGALPEWTPADHTNQANPSAGQIDTSQKRAGMEKLEARGINDVVLAAWKTNCVTCHGNAGQGDGPQGRMVRPPDMTNPKWQKTRIDSEMKYTIQNGKGRMPAFAHLPEKTVDGLVQLVRMLNPEFREKAAAETEAETAADTDAPAEAKGEKDATPADAK